MSLNPTVPWKSRNEKLKSDSEQKKNYAWKINLLYIEKQTKSTIVYAKQSEPGKIFSLPSTHPL